MENIEEIIQQLKVGGTQIINENDLRTKLEERRPLRIKFGVDPTAPDLHIGHAVPLLKLRQFQDLGHIALLVIGDYTSMVGDPSGRSSTRPILTYEEVLANAETYKTQAFKILDHAKTEVVFNSTWFGKMNFIDVIRLNARMTLQQVLQREDFKSRLDKTQPVFMHELQYPLMQGWDSVMIRADVELGGTDQLFNLMVGRDLQKAEGQTQQVACIVPILEGLDGVLKMSKSLGNYVGVTEPPSEMFGKLMSISDQLMVRYYEVLLAESAPSDHPMEAKKRLAYRTVKRFHDQAAAERALADFDKRFAKKDLENAELPEVAIGALGPDILSMVVNAYSIAFQLKKSRSEARRLVEQGSVQIVKTDQTEKMTDVKATPQLKAGDILRLDKTKAIRTKA